MGEIHATYGRCKLLHGSWRVPVMSGARCCYALPSYGSLWFGLKKSGLSLTQLSFRLVHTVRATY
jgi:hypothetical protein